MLKKKKADILQWEEYKSLLTGLEQDRHYKLLMFAVLSGMLGLRPSDILSISWNEVLKEGNPNIGRILKNENIKEIIERVLKSQGIKDTKEKIFINRFKKKPITGQYINRELKKLKVKYNLTLQNFSTHSFRKMYGRKILEENSFSKESLEFLRIHFSHPNIQTTKEYLELEIKEIPKIQVITEIKF